MVRDRDKLTIETHSPEETERLGHALCGLLPSGAVVALHGELASGKTCLVRGMAARFEMSAAVSSPTFTIVNEYGPLRHMDLYRLDTLEEIIGLGYEELFEPDGVCVVEWAERAGDLLPGQRVDVWLEHTGNTSRRVTVDNRGALQGNWHEALAGIDR